MHSSAQNSVGIRTYVQVEASVGAALSAAVRPVADAIATAAAGHAGEDKPENALGILDKWAPAALPEAVKAKLGELAISALFFGASRLGNPRESRWMTHLPELQLKIAVQQAEIMVTQGLKKNLQTQVGKLVSAYRRDTATPEVIPGLSKADCCAGTSILKADAFYTDLADAMNAAVMGTGRAVVDVAANLTTSRLAAYGFLGEAKSRGVQRFQRDATLDERICPVCEYLHGKSFDVDSTFGKAESLLLLDDPEDLRKAAPFVRQNKSTLDELRSMNATEIQAKGWHLTPSHPGCRCVLVADGDIATTMEPVPLKRLVNLPEGLGTMAEADSDGEQEDDDDLGFWGRLVSMHLGSKKSSNPQG